MNRIILTLAFFAIVSCSTRSGRRHERKIAVENTPAKVVESDSIPVWFVVNKTTAFEFVDHENMIQRIKNAGLKEVTLVNTYDIPGDSTKSFVNTGWSVASVEGLTDTAYYYGSDSSYYERRIMILALNRFKIKTYKYEIDG